MLPQFYNPLVPDLMEVKPRLIITNRYCPEGVRVLNRCRGCDIVESINGLNLRDVMMPS